VLFERPASQPSLTPTISLDLPANPFLPVLGYQPKQHRQEFSGCSEALRRIFESGQGDVEIENGFSCFGLNEQLVKACCSLLQHSINRFRRLPSGTDARRIWLGPGQTGTGKTAALPCPALQAGSATNARPRCWCSPHPGTSPCRLPKPSTPNRPGQLSAPGCAIPADLRGADLRGSDRQAESVVFQSSGRVNLAGSWINMPAGNARPLRHFAAWCSTPADEHAAVGFNRTSNGCLNNSLSSAKWCCFSPPQCHIGDPPGSPANISRIQAESPSAKKGANRAPFPSRHLSRQWNQKLEALTRCLERPKARTGLIYFARTPRQSPSRRSLKAP